MFIANLKKYRKAKKLSQMKIAEQCDTSAGYIGEIEIGKKFPSVEMIERLAETLEIRPHLLFMEEDDPSPPNRINAKKMLIRKIQQAVEEIVLGEEF